MTNEKANYRKINDHTHNSSTYHKKDGTNVRAKMKEQLQQEVNETSKNNIDDQDVVSQVERLLLASFLTMEEIAARVGISVSEVDKIMMAMEVPNEE
jgi:AraC-like DNA-binding protein